MQQRNQAADHDSARRRSAVVVTCAVERQHIAADTYQDHQLPGGMGILAIAG